MRTCKGKQEWTLLLLLPLLQHYKPSIPSLPSLASTVVEKDVLKDFPSLGLEQDRQGGKSKQPHQQHSQRGSFGGNQRGISSYFVRGGIGVRTNLDDYVDVSTNSTLNGTVVAFIARQRGMWEDSHM